MKRNILFAVTSAHQIRLLQLPCNSPLPCRGSPDDEVDACDTRVEEDDAVYNEGNSFPEGVKGASSLNLDVNIPLVGCSSIQAIHRHSNYAYTPFRVSRKHDRKMIRALCPTETLQVSDENLADVCV